MPHFWEHKKGSGVLVKGERFLFLKGLTLSLHYLASKWSFEARRWVNYNPGQTPFTWVPTRSVSVVTVLQIFSWQKPFCSYSCQLTNKTVFITLPFQVQEMKTYWIKQCWFHIFPISISKTWSTKLPSYSSTALVATDCLCINCLLSTLVTSTTLKLERRRNAYVWKDILKCLLLNLPNISADSKAQTSKSNSALKTLVRTVSSIIMITHSYPERC